MLLLLQRFKAAITPTLKKHQVRPGEDLSRINLVADPSTSGYDTNADDLPSAALLDIKLRSFNEKDPDMV